MWLTPACANFSADATLAACCIPIVGYNSRHILRFAQNDAHDSDPSKSGGSDGH